MLSYIVQPLLDARKGPLAFRVPKVAASMEYRLSQYLHFFRHATESVTALWHALNFEVAYLDSATAESLAALADRTLTEASLADLLSAASESPAEVLRGLVAAAFLVPAHGYKEDSAIDIAAEMERRRYIGVLYLILCDGCNFNCSYCFETRYTPPSFSPMRMPASVVEAGLNAFARLYNLYPPPKGHEPKIQLYGGEPFLNPEGFCKAVLHVELLKRTGELDDRVQVATVTNGSKLTPELVEFVTAHGVSIGVSLDGPRTIDTAHRKCASGEDSYTLAVAAYRALRARGAKVGLSVTLTPEVVAGFDSVLDFLLNDLEIDRGLGFNILHHTDSVELPPSYYKDAAACMLKAFQLFRTRGIWEERMMRKAVAFADAAPMHSDCAAIGHQIVVAPDGMIGICQDFVKDRRTFAHTVFDPSFDPFNDALFLTWAQRSPLRMPECQHCPALGICGGGCPASIEAEKGSMWNVDYRICPHSLETLRFLIWDAYAAQTSAQRGTGQSLGHQQVLSSPAKGAKPDLRPAGWRLH